MLTLTSILSTPESSYLEGKSAKGGVSDPRNATLLKMFSFIRFGERAGSGLNGIVYVWKKVYHTDPEIFVKEEYDRTFLKLPTLGKEPDVEAMAEFYPDEEEQNENVTVNDPVNVRVNDPINENDPVNVTANDPVNDPINGNDPVNVTVNDPVNENDPVNVRVNERLLVCVTKNPHGTYKEFALLLGKSPATIKRLLKQLRENGTIRRVGADKNGHWEVINNQ